MKREYDNIPIPEELGVRIRREIENSEKRREEKLKAFRRQKIKKNVADKDLEELAELTAFPLYVGLTDAGPVKDKADFLAIGAEKIFTDELLHSVETADIEKLQPSMAGFSISGDKGVNINFGVTDGKLAINGINY